MKRLTRKSQISDMVWFIDHENSNIDLEPCEMNPHHNRLAIHKLAEYEDLEEQCLNETTFSLRMLLRKWKEFFEDIQELAEYRKLKKQGRLLILQFRVGDRVWDDEFKSSYRITGYSFGTAEDYIHDPVSESEVVYYCTNYCGSIIGSFSESEIGKTIFHSREEAEAVLEKMKGEEHE